MSLRAGTTTAAPAAAAARVQAAAAGSPLAGPHDRLQPDEGAVRDIRARVTRWFRRHARLLPWRDGYDPYAVWVSEMMLQQTQVVTVLPYFARWMARFPDVQALALAPLQDVLKAWEGLGYYARARNLHRAAGLVLQRHEGRLPHDPTLLRALPGIGPYTAGAIASIAFNHAAPAVDGNVARVLSRLVVLPWPWRSPAAETALWALAARLVPPRGARLFNQGLMELGALVCRDKAPACGRCPLRAKCAAYAAGEPQAWPLRRTRRARRQVRGVLAVVCAEGALLLRRCPEDGLWGGLYEFPWLASAAGEAAQATAERLLGTLGTPASASPGPAWPLRHELTHLALALDCRVYVAPARHGRAAGPAGLRWVTRSELAGLPLSRVGHKVLAQLDTALPQRQEGIQGTRAGAGPPVTFRGDRPAQPAVESP